MIFDGFMSICTIALFFNICRPWTIKEAMWIFVKNEILFLWISTYSFKVRWGRCSMITYCSNGEFSLVSLKYSEIKIDGVPLNFETIFNSCTTLFLAVYDPFNLFDLKNNVFLICFFILSWFTTSYFVFFNSSSFAIFLWLDVYMYQNYTSAMLISENPPPLIFLKLILFPSFNSIML